MRHEAVLRALARAPLCCVTAEDHLVTPPVLVKSHLECKQLVAGVVPQADGIPIDADVYDGNMDDSTWSRKPLLTQGRPPIFATRSYL